MYINKELINTLCYIYTMPDYTEMKMKELLLFKQPGRISLI